MTRHNPILWQAHYQFSDWKRAAMTITGTLIWIGVFGIALLAMVIG